MTIFFRLGFAAALSLWLDWSCLAAENKDIKAFIKNAFHEKIEAIQTGIYCRTLSCNFEVDSFFVTETVPKTSVFSASGWLEGTIPGLKGSARRTVGVTGTYTQGTCIVKDLKPIIDTLTNNNGWGASKIEAVFGRIQIPATVVLSPEDCQKLDGFIFGVS